MQQEFYNTTGENKSVVEKTEASNSKQENLILSLFINHPFEEYTPFEVSKYLNLPNVPITSVRRAITNLTQKGFLFKTENKKQGDYGKINFCWRLAKRESIQSVLFPASYSRA